MTKRNQENEEREDKIGMNYQKGHKQKPIVATINQLNHAEKLRRSTLNELQWRSKAQEYNAYNEHMEIDRKTEKLNHIYK